MSMKAKVKTRSTKPPTKKKKENKDSVKMTPSSRSSLLMLTSQLVSIGRFNEGLPSFITRGLDAEQIWQQLELRNDHNLSLPAMTKELVKITTHTHKSHKRKSNKREKLEEWVEDNEHLDNSDSDLSDDEEGILKSIKERLAEEESQNKENDFNIGENEDSDELDFDFEFDNEFATGLSDEESEKKSKKKAVNKTTEKRKTVVDDKFFKLSEMEEFLDAEDLKDAKRTKRENKKENPESEDDDDSEESEDEEVDLFAADDSEGEEDPMYADFFDPPEEDGSEKKRKTKPLKTVDDKHDDKEEEPSLSDESDMEKDDVDDDDEKEKKSSLLEDSEKKDQSKKKVAFTEDLLHSDEETDTKKKLKSTFERKQEELQAKAREMEDLSVKEVSWELLGEATATKRPENSLLETVLDFQHTTRAAPVITEETTKSLEDYIKQRIKDQTFDDVERKEKKKEDVFEFKKRIVLDQEKSKISLGELYEQEFMKQQQEDKNEVKADPECENIEKELNKLFHQLDALSNFRYTPMKPGTEVKIIVNTPAIAMEEVAPVATADADLLAPEEVYEKKKGELKADDERTETDKNRARRVKKVQKRERKKAKEAREKLVEKLKPGLGNKYSKAKALKQLEQISKSDKNITLIKGDKEKKLSSTSFFNQLQDQTKVTQTNVKPKLKKVVDSSKIML
ncbi:U3 small nucleolar ribonucleoprotein MPP10 [Biomphalaria pfeifferi]|uniref:U3 small nucleolar ribonucleoprotein protein MPP10 n=1 Tax=Biomphalaria pfeifferi TaxID=112525 RepID=A0AAD8FPW5_BIOPF|nr:U3 small nucleolar ribonucleoprotein MPP10 [Biomphalaria pfeifferi]